LWVWFQHQKVKDLAYLSHYFLRIFKADYENLSTVSNQLWPRVNLSCLIPTVLKQKAMLQPTGQFWILGCLIPREWVNLSVGFMVYLTCQKAILDLWCGYLSSSRSSLRQLHGTLFIRYRSSPDNMYIQRGCMHVFRKRLAAILQTISSIYSS
jgi:hypothetical protein